MAEMTSGSIGKLEALPSSARQERHLILDALRFILALWVAIGHLGAFPLLGADPMPGIAYTLSRGLNTLVWGMPAVMAFFVVSGFCIHYPSQAVKAFSIPRFYLRRYTRTVLPVIVILVTMVAYRGAGQVHWLGRQSVFFESTLWSLLCEELYYALYPALRWVRRHVGWTPILAVTMGISVVWATLSTPASSWSDIGPLGTAVILYPVWLLGCVLAEWRVAQRMAGARDMAPAADVTLGRGRQAERFSGPASVDAPVSPRQARRSIWMWRGIAWSAMWFSELLNFHTPVTQVHTMLFVGIVAFFWIRAELAVSRFHVPSRWLVQAGAWSYSLYLVHPVVYDLLTRWLPSVPPVSRLGWCAYLVLALIFAYLFFKLIEQPTHRGAQKVGLLKAPQAGRKLLA